MKHLASTSLLVLTFMCAACEAGDTPLHKRITVQYEGKPLGEALKDAATQAGA